MKESLDTCLQASQNGKSIPELTAADLTGLDQGSRTKAEVNETRNSLPSPKLNGAKTTISCSERTWAPSVSYERSFWQDRSADDQSESSPSNLSPQGSPHISKAVERWTPLGKAQTALMTATTAVCGAWSLIMAQVSNTNTVSMDISIANRSGDTIPANLVHESEKPSSVLLDVSSVQKLSEYLAIVQQQLKDTTCLIGEATHTNGDSEENHSHQMLVSRISSTFEVRKASGPQEVVALDNTPTKLNLCNLVLQIFPSATKITVSAGFDPVVVDEAFVDKLLKRLEHTMRQIDSMSHDLSLAEIQTLSPQELDQIWMWNHAVPVSIERCIHEVITDRGLSQPNGLAICAWDGQVTYKELDQLTSEVARRLIFEFGVGTGKIVPLYFEKSMWTSVAMLGILKAGAAFVTLDRSVPEQRLRVIVEQVKADLVLSSVAGSSFVSRIAPRVFAIGPHLAMKSDDRGQPCTDKPNASSPAYICFSSGSSGTPKGAIISHANLSSAVHHQAEVQGFLPTSRVFDFASYGFITSLSGTFMTLATGGCLCVPSEDDRKVRLAESVRRFEANTIILTRSVAQLLSPDDVPTLRTLIFAGEALHVADARRWWDRLRVLNRYGISECTAGCTINLDASNPDEVCRMGKGIGVVTWVVDQEDHNQLLPPGCIGELLVEGPPVSRGYLNDAVKDAAAFIENPTWLLEGASGYAGRNGRLYKTGDLVQYEENGSLSYIGRKETQNKIRGLRVDLGDVEQHLQECMPEALQVVADIITPPGANASSMLVTFVKLSSTKVADGTIEVLPITLELEAELVKRLPTYMVPTIVFSLSQLPVTATGKIHRRRLREMGASFSTQQLADMRTTSQYPKRQPYTELEKSIQIIWSQVLGITRIGLDDNFFHLGGDSIAAMRTVTMAYEKNIQLDIQYIFRHPKLCDLAAQSTYILRKASEPIAPFVLLGDTFDKSALLRDVSKHYPIDQHMVQDAYSSTPLQQGLISLSSKHAGDYLIQNVLELASDISVERMCRSWEAVARVTPALRTRLVQYGKEGLIQVVLDEQINWINTEMDLGGYLKFDKTLPMDLGSPLTRYALVKSNAGSFQWLVWSIHHAIFDGWAKGLIADAVWRVYEGASLDQGTHFNSFVKYINDQDDNNIEIYWSKALANCEATPFPTLPQSISQPRVDEKVELCFTRTRQSQRDVTVSTLIRAAWALTTARMTNAQDVVFGCTVSGRNAPIIGVERMIGPAFATIPLRVEVKKDALVSDYLKSSHQQSVDMIPYEQSGLHRISKISSDTKRTCSFQTLLVIQPPASTSTSVNGSSDHQSLGVWRDDDQQEFHTYALVLEVKPGPTNLHIKAMFDSRALNTKVALELLERLELVLRQLDGATANTRLADIKVVLPQDLEQIRTWNQCVPDAVEQCVDELFEHCVRLQPHAAAIHAWDGDLTYTELYQLAAPLACHLAQLGVAPGEIVPLCFEKSMWAVVAALGVLKAGGGFLLLDPSFPKLRLEAMVRQLNPLLILSSSSNKELSSQLCETVLEIGQQCKATLGPSAGPARRSRPSAVMYAIFTSGSTGVPKGCALSHSNFCSAFKYQARSLGFSPHSRLFEFASYGFDVSVHNIFTTLLAGGCLCIPSEYDRKNNINKAIKEMSASMINLTPTMAQFVDPTSNPQLQTLLLAGEAAFSDDITRWWGKSHVINTYGPCECTSTSLVNCCASTAKETTYLGRGMGQVTWIVDPEDDQSLLPPGCIGELMLEGPLVGCGYLNDHERTASAFIETPIWLREVAGRRGKVYKTGDLVRYTDGGTLVFIGRKDTQAKIYGQRIDLHEVDYWVRHCVEDSMSVGQIVTEIILPSGNNPRPTLVTFLEIKDIPSRAKLEKADLVMQMRPIPPKIEHELAQHLAAYMMPKVFFCSRQMPMTGTGKLDRKQLREVGASFSLQQWADIRATIQGPKRQPTLRSELDVQLIWSRLFDIKLDLIGLDDSFFHLGGDSISAMKAVGEAYKIGLRLSVADFFRHPRLCDLANQATDVRNETEEEIVPFSLLSHTREVNVQAILQDISGRYDFNMTALSDAYPCTPLQEGLMALTSKRSGDFIAQNVLELSPNVNIDGLRLAWEQVVCSVPILRTRIVVSDLGLLQIVLDENVLWINEDNLDGYLKADRSISMDLGDPLARFAIIEDGVDSRWFVWTVHHALYDGWSRDLVLQMFDRAFAGNSINRNLRFKSFIKYTQEQNDENSKNYWRETLSDYDSLPFPTLPPTIQYPMADERIEHHFPRPNSIENDITVPTLYRAAWAVIVGGMSHSKDVVFGATVSGRNASVTGINEMTGPTIAAVPIRVQLQDQRVSKYLQSMQRQATDMIAFEQTGLQNIAKTCPGAQKACSFQTQLVIQPQGRNFDQTVMGDWQARTPKHAFNAFALVIEMRLGEHTIAASAMFDPNVITPWIVQGLLKRLDSVAQQLNDAYPETLLSEIDVITQNDVDQVWQWNAIVPPPAQQTVEQMITHHVRTTPTAPAICAWDGSLSYQELDSLASKLALELLDLEVGPDTIVPLCFEKSMWTSVAVLAVLKLNSSFVLLDPSLPEQRLQSIVRQIRGKLRLIISSPLNQDLSSRLGQTILILSSDFFSTLRSQSVLPTRSTEPLAILYIVFTSGSTGVPKGAAITYSNIAAALYYQIGRYGLSAKSRVYDFASYSYDASINNILMTFAAGGCLCIPNDHDRKNNLEESMTSLFANTIDITPSVARLISPAGVPHLKLIIFAGEPLRIADLERWWGKVELRNGYGPCECTTTSTINESTSSPEELLQIGTGAGLVTWVVDPVDDQRLLPLGCVGELVLEGPLVGHGYLNNAHNVDKFVQDPIWLLHGGSDQPGRHGRVYKTGDLVRYNAEGNLSFIGRKDFQVKIRGQRVELGEIEQLVREQEYIDDAAVVLQQESEQHVRMVCFAVLGDSDSALEAKVIGIEEAQHVEQWKKQFDSDIFRPIQKISPEVIGKDFIGWTSMYDGSDIEKGEMKEWLEDTIRTILDGRQPGHVLEIGTGSGMILFNISEGLESYVGIEPSEQVAEFVAKTAKSIPELADKVKMVTASAADLRRVDVHLAPKLVVMNSVVQYFPSQAYLLRVVEDLIRLEGVETLFFGDIRSYALHKDFLASRAVHITGEKASKDKIKQIIADMELAESELLIDPGFFTSLPDRLPDRIEHIEILPKRMRATNELSCYRYAAIVHVKTPHQRREAHEIDETSWIDFTKDKLDYRSLLHMLRHGSTSFATAISNIPCSKNIYDSEVRKSVDKFSNSAPAHSDWLLNAHQMAQRRSCLSAVDLVDLAENSGHQVEISWARQYSQAGGLDAIFHRVGNGGSRVLFRFPNDHKGRPYNSFSSQPLRQQSRLKAQEQLDRQLRTKLPSHMVPESIVILQEMPISTSGKIDRRALTNKIQTSTTERKSIRQPTSKPQREMQKIWGQVLGIEPAAIGLDERFFKLGGDSIAAMKVVGEARNVGLKLSVADIFRHPSLQDLTYESCISTDNLTEEIAPFALLDGKVDVPSFLEGISSDYQLHSASIHDAYPCTPLQEGLMSLTTKRTGAYIAQHVLKLSSDLQEHTLCKAWEEVVRVTPILGTRFIQHIDTGFVQIVVNESIDWIDATDLDEYLQLDRGISMNLGEPLTRFALVRDTSGKPGWFVWSVHHALYDGWSIGLIWNAVRHAFSGEPIKQGTQFQSFVKYIQDQRWEGMRSFWQDYLKDYESVPFPTLPPLIDQPVVDEVLQREFFLQNSRRSTDSTDSTLIRAAWALIVGQMIGSEDIAFGVTVSGRHAPLPGIETIAAPTFATLPIRVKLDKHQKVLDYINMIHRQTADMIPFEQVGLQRIANMSGESKQACMFQTLLIVQPPRDKLVLTDDKFPGKWEKNDQRQWMSDYALMLEVQVEAGKFQIQASFDSRVLQPWMIHELLERLEFVIHQLDGVGVSAQTTLREMNMITPQASERIWKWNSTIPPPLERCVQDLFQDRAESQPNAPAICAWDGELMCGELNDLSARLATKLIDCGVTKDVLVPLCFEKSLWTAVAALAVLKAGGAFVLLDPSLPQQRLQIIIQQLNASLIVSSCTNEQLASQLCKTVFPIGPQIIDAFEPLSHQSSQSQLSSTAMCVIFTSGSTGTPKGAILSHANFCSGYRVQALPLGFKQSSRVLDFASYAFDMSVHNMFVTLLSGGCLCIPSEKDRQNDVGKAMVDMGVTLATLTPSVARLIDPNRIKLENLLLGGEPVYESDVARWWGKTQITNIYGPAECTPISLMNSNASTIVDSAHLGKGAGVLTWIVDPQDHDVLLPPGCVGELLLEGPLVGCGYLNDPQKTTLAFVKDPLWLAQSTPSRRGRHGMLYKTGDLVRYREDGNIIYCGRKDAQVKVHGQRIELAEVEYWVRKVMSEDNQLIHIGVEIILPGGQDSRPMLAAFIQARDEIEDMNETGTPTAKVLCQLTDMEDRLAQHLPRYMIPAVFFSLPKLPVTVTGKINRRQLREIGGSFTSQELAAAQTSGQAPKRQPTSEVEIRMQMIWARVLHLEPATIGLDDNLFRLGGDSIAAMKIVSEAGKRGMRLSVADIFRKPKLSDCAHWDISSSSSVTPEDIGPFTLMPDEPNVSSLLQDIANDYQLSLSIIEDAYPCTPLQEGLITLTLKQPGDYIAQNVFELPPDMDIERLQTAWQQVAHSMPILRTRFVQHSSVGFISIVTAEALSWTEANDLEGYLDIDSRRPMDLGSLFMRFSIIRGGGNSAPGWFVWTIHHALYDRQSVDRVMDAVQSAYRGGKIARPLAFQNFVKFVKSQDDKKVNSYWQQALIDCNCLPFPPLPISLNKIVADNVIDHSFQYRKSNLLGMTTSVLVHAAWALIVGRMTDVEDVSFGVTVSGRNAPIVAIDEIVGPTIATVPMRLRPARAQLVSEYLEAVHERTTEMIPFEQTGLQNIARISAGARKACTFQTHLFIQPGKKDVHRTSFWKLRSAGHRAYKFNTYALTVELWIENDSITASAMFDPAVIAPSNVRGLLHRLDFVLQQFNGSADPGSTLKDISITTQYDLDRIWKWNSSVPPPADQTVQQMIAKWYQTTPDAPAICACDGKLTYRELDKLTTALANWLHKSGIRRDTLVPLCFEKSMWTSVAILGILKVNAGFILLDPALPERRLQHLVQQTKSTVILCSHLNQNLSSRLSQTAVTIDPEFFSGLKDQELQELDPPSLSSVLYVVFTSGSTGEPKGVAITYSNTASALHYQIDRLGLTTETRMFDFASYSVDVTISNLMMTLAAGGCLCVPSDEDRKSNLEQSILALQANTFDLTPSVAQLINPEIIPEVHSMIFGGEPLRTTEIERWSGKTRQICNAYGATECTMNSTINSNVRDPSDTSHIGKGAGLVPWIVSPEDDNELLAPGNTGELLLEGPLVGHGYLNDEEKTALTFIRDPNWLLEGTREYPGRRGRLYKTGDLVRYTEDGDLCFVGRKDTQIKIYGQRVELSEVEYWFQKHVSKDILASQVVAEIVMPSGGGNSGHKLVAFLQVDNLADEANADRDDTAPKLLPVTQDVETMLGHHLPRHMIPKAQFQMRRLPVLPTGKTDRKKLRAIGASVSVQRYAMTQTAAAGLKQPPESNVEQCLQDIWSRLLNISLALIGREDSFFDLGGDSVTAIQTIGKARTSGIKLSTGDVFRYPRLCDLAEKAIYITGADAPYVKPYALIRSGVVVADLTREISAQYSLDPTAICDIYPCTPLQEGLFALTTKRPEDYITQNVFELTSPDIVAKDLCTAWEKVHAQLPILRTKFVQHEAIGLAQMVSNDCIRWSNATNLDMYLHADRTTPMRLGEPLVRYALVDDPSSKSSWFVWTIHHVLFDGWSMSLILEVVNRVIRGESIRKGPQFQSFIEYVGGRDQAVATDYWRKAFANYDSLPFPALPSAVKVPLTDKISQYKLSQPRLHGKGITNSTMIKAAWAIVASRMTDGEDVVFGLTVSGRDAPVAGVESMIAPTFATVPVRIRPTHSLTVPAYLHVVQQQAVEMVPFEQTGLRRIASISPEANNACQFQTLLVIQPPQKTNATDDTRKILGKWQGTDQQQWLNNYGLMLEITLGSDGFDVMASFDTHVLEPWIVDGLLKRLDFTIQQLSNASHQHRVADIKSLTPHDLEQIWKWNDPAALPIDRCAHDIFRERALSRPTAPAISAWDGQLSYQDLDQLSTHLMCRLTKLGVKADTLVPICFEKSMWAPIVALSVLKAGGGVVLLDCSLPEQRLQSIVDQLDATFIISSTSNCQLTSRLCKTVLEISAKTCGPSERLGPSDGLPDLARSTQLSSTAMYAVFTSGTTGTPKGVVASHSNFCSGWQHQEKLLGFGEDVRVFDFASYAFDVSIHNIFATFLSGGCLCIPSEQDRQNDITGALASTKATFVHLTPSVARLIDPSAVPQLQTLSLVGEPVVEADVVRWWGRTNVINAYGPAECHFTTINWEQSSPKDIISIGKAIGSTAWIVDPQFHQTIMPLGMVGELLIEGPIVGRGYLGDAQRTVSSFIEDPSWLLHGSLEHSGRHGRLYKTGDLVRYAQDGKLMFVGRKDTQVKIHGQRVELNEVESVVKACVSEAMQVVAELVAPSTQDSSPVLTAFVLLDKDVKEQKPKPQNLSEYPISAEVERKLAERLPKHMIPRMILSINELPMSNTGKINRRSLREVAASLLATTKPTSGLSRPSVVTDVRLIFNEEQPAYTLAEKVSSMLPLWRRPAEHSDEKKSERGRPAFEDLALLPSGLDSVNMMTLMYFIWQKFQVKVSMQLLLDTGTSIRSLARFISDSGTARSGIAHSSASLDLMDEINHYDQKIINIQMSPSRNVDANLHLIAHKPSSWNEKHLTVLLTGASGFIGTQVLYQLLKNSKIGLVIAVVRGKTRDIARSRTIDSARKALWWTNTFEEKLQVWPGDLSMPRLGLEASAWATVIDGHTVDLIIHNGAVVHWGKSYAALKATNVSSTIDLLQVALTAPRTTFVYVTGGRISASPDEKEEDVLEELTSPGSDGYGQTKYVAEAVVKRAMLRQQSRRTRIAIVGPGLVVGTPSEGIPNMDDFIWRLVAACVGIGSFNVGLANLWLPVSDAATVARTIVDTALVTTPTSRAITKVDDGMTWGDFWATIEEVGYQLRAKPKKQWSDDLREDMNLRKENHPLWPVAYLFETESQATNDNTGSWSETGHTSNSLKLAIRKSAETLWKIGFLPPPPTMVREGEGRRFSEVFSRSFDTSRAVRMG